LQIADETRESDLSSSIHDRPPNSFTFARANNTIPISKQFDRYKIGFSYCHIYLNISNFIFLIIKIFMYVK